MLTVKVGYFYNFGPNEIMQAWKGIGLLQRALNDENFQTMVLSADFVETLGMGNQELIERLLGGADCIDETEDHVVNLDFRMYKNIFSRVIGYVLGNSRTIHVNKKFFGNPKNFASNILHEYMHILGFKHTSAVDYGSVPYKMNSIFGVWCDRNSIS